MFSWSNFHKRLQERKFNRKIAKAEKETQEVASGFWELYHLAATFHGRLHLMTVIDAADHDEIYIDPEVLGLYRYVLVTSPYSAYAVFN